jgi:hypothetical protein
MSDKISEICMVTNLNELSGYQPSHLVDNYRRFRGHLCPHVVPETSVICSQRTWFIGREYFIDMCALSAILYISVVLCR